MNLKDQDRQQVIMTSLAETEASSALTMLTGILHWVATQAEIICTALHVHMGVRGLFADCIKEMPSVYESPQQDLVIFLN